MLELAVEADKNNPSDRQIYQYLVDEHCNSSRICCEGLYSDDVAKFPPKFTIRALRRFNEMLTEEQTGRTKKARCYEEHVDEEATDCGKLHMRYDVEKDFGFFGEEVRCVVACGGVRECDCDAASASSSSGSDSESGADRDYN